MAVFSYPSSAQFVFPQAGGGSGSPGGSDGQLQVNDSGSFGGLSAVTWDSANDKLVINNTNNSSQFQWGTGGFLNRYNNAVSLSSQVKYSSGNWIRETGNAGIILNFNTDGSFAVYQSDAGTVGELANLRLPMYIEGSGKLHLAGDTAAGADVGYVLTLQNTSTGEVAWQAPAGGGGGIETYANAAALPETASNYDLAITLDTGDLYTYSTVSETWNKYLNVGLGTAKIYSPSDSSVAIDTAQRALVNSDNYNAIEWGASSYISINRSIRNDGEASYDIGQPNVRFGDAYLSNVYANGMESNHGDLYFDCTNGPVVMSSQAESVELKPYNETVAPSLAFYNKDATHYAKIKVPDTLAANYTLTLPTTAGTNGYVLSTNGSGALSWVSAGGITWATPINSSITVDATNTYNIGSADYKINNIYARYLKDSNGVTVFGIDSHSINDTSGNLIINLSSKSLLDTSGNLSVAWSSRTHYDSTEKEAISWQSRVLKDTSEGSSLTWSSTTKLEANKPFVFLNSASDPSSPTAGMVYYNTSANKLKVYTGSVWETVTSA